MSSSSEDWGNSFMSVNWYGLPGEKFLLKLLQFREVPLKDIGVKERLGHVPRVLHIRMFIIALFVIVKNCKQ